MLHQSSIAFVCIGHHANDQLTMALWACELLVVSSRFYIMYHPNLFLPWYGSIVQIKLKISIIDLRSHLFD